MDIFVRGNLEKKCLFLIVPHDTKPAFVDMTISAIFSIQDPTPNVDTYHSAKFLRFSPTTARLSNLDYFNWKFIAPSEIVLMLIFCCIHQDHLHIR